MGKMNNSTSLKPADITINAVLQKFLDAQEQQLSARTFRQYDDVIELLMHCIKSYGYNYLDEREKELYDRLYKEEEVEFCDIFGPEKILGNIDEFLDYFMIRKVMASKSLMKAAGIVTGKLVKWMEENGYADKEEAGYALETTSKVSKDLPVSIDIANLLNEYCMNSYQGDASRTIEDYFLVEKIEQGNLWLYPIMSGEATIGPVPVPEEITKKLECGWQMGLLLEKTKKGWRIRKVGDIYPR